MEPELNVDRLKRIGSRALSREIPQQPEATTRLYLWHSRSFIFALRH
jgi:hypothetical protein